MLPLELVEKVLGELDVTSLLSLSNTSRFWRSNITEIDFQHKLQTSCPWFEPQYSYRKTWRECAVEYARRKRGSKFCPQQVLSADFENKELTTQDFEYSMEYNKSGIYTSKHGISIDLSDLDDGERDEAHEFIQEEIFSYPHILLIVIFDAKNMNHADWDVIVKFRDSPGLKPDVQKYIEGEGELCLYVLEFHTFIFYNESHGRPKALYLQKDRFVHIDVGSFDTGLGNLKHAVVYDGLFVFFEPKRHICMQASLDSVSVSDSRSTKHLIEVTHTYRVPWWNSRYVLLKGSGTEGNTEEVFFFDVQRGTLERDEY